MADFKRGFLIFLLVMLGLSVLLLIFAILSSGGRGIEIVVGSALGVGALVLLCFAAYPTFDRPNLRLVSLPGALLGSMMMFALPVILSIGESYRSELLPKLTVMVYLIVGAMCLIPLVLLPRIKPPSNVIQITTAGLMALTVFILFILLWAEPSRGEDVGRLIAILIVLSGAGAVTTFVVARYHGIKVADPLSTVQGRMFLRCPRCEREQTVELGAPSRCAACQLIFKVEVEEPRCPKCGYNLYNLQSSVCPECGQPIPGKDPAADPNSPLLAWARANDQENQPRT